LQIHGRAYPDASGACCGSDNVLVQELLMMIAFIITLGEIM